MKTFASTLTGAALTLVILGASSRVASGQVVTIEIAGHVTSVSDPNNTLGGAITNGQSISGRYTYDLSTPDTNSTPESAKYQHNSPPAGIVVNVPPFVFQTDASQVDFAIMLNDAPGEESYIVESLSNLPLPGGNQVHFIHWALVKPGGGALSGTALTGNPPELSKWLQNQLFLIGIGAFGPFQIEATVTSATLASSSSPTLSSSERQPGSVGIFPVHRSGLGGVAVGGPGHADSGELPPTFFTVVSVTNTDTQPQTPQSLGGATNVHYQYVNVTPNPQDPFKPLACSIFDRVEFLTPADTLSVLTSCHNAASPKGQQGYLVVSAQDPGLFDTDWSHNDLIGGELVVNSSGGMYQVAMISLPSPVADGQPTDLPDPLTTIPNGQLDFDGKEYAQLPDQVMVDSFIALGNSQLSLANLTGGLSAVNTLKISAWNDNEFALSATRTFACWFDERLSSVSPLFTQAFLANNTPDDPQELDLDCNGTGDLETAWARIDSIGVTQPDGFPLAPDGVVLGAVTAGPSSLIDGGVLLWQSAATQDNGSFGAP